MTVKLIRCRLNDKDPAVSTLVGVILMIFLVVTLAAVMEVLIYGLIFPFEKTAYVVTDAELVNTSSGVPVISLFHRGGDIMQYENLTTDPSYELRLMIDTSDGGFVVKTEKPLLSDTSWSPGDNAYIFRNATGYLVTNNLSKVTGAIPFPPGPVGVRVIDNTHHQLVAFPTAGVSTGGPTSAPTNTIPTTVPTTSIPTTIPTTAIPTTIPTTVPTTATPTTVPTTAVPTTVPTTVAPTPAPSQECANCGTGTSFSVSFTTEILGTHQLRFKDDSSPQPNLRAWTFGDGGSASGELIDHTFPEAGSYQITLTVKKNNNPCTCTLTRWVTVG